MANPNGLLTPQDLLNGGQPASQGTAPPPPVSQAKAAPAPAQRPASPPAAPQGGGAGAQPPEQPKSLWQQGAEALGTLGQFLNPVTGPIAVGQDLLTGGGDGKGSKAVSLGAGVIRAAPQAFGALADFSNDVGTMVGNSIAPSFIRRGADDPVNKALIAYHNSPVGQAVSHIMDPEGDGRLHAADRLSGKNTVVGHAGNDEWNQNATQIMSLAVGYGGAANVASRVGATELAANLIKAIPSKGARFAANIAVGGVGAGGADAVFMDPEQERLSNALQAMGAHNEFIDWLAAKPGEQENAMEGRFKNAIEGTIGGVALDGVMSAAKFWIKSAKASAFKGGIPTSTQAELTTLQARVKAIADKQVADAAPPVQPGETPPPSPLQSILKRNVDVATPEDAAGKALDDDFARIRTKAQRRTQLRQALTDAEGAAPQDVPVVTPSSPRGADLTADITGPNTNADVGEAAGVVPGPETTGPSAITPSEPQSVSAPQEELAQGTRHDDTPPPPPASEKPSRKGGKPVTPSALSPDQTRAAVRSKIVRDASAALKKAGAAEKVTDATMEVSPTGKIRVRPETKSALDAANLGTAFESTATPVTKDAVILRSKGTNAAYDRIVGVTSREDIAALGRDITHWRDQIANEGRQSVDITHADTPDTAARQGEFHISNLGSDDKVPGLIRAMVEQLPPSVRPRADADLIASARLVASQIGEDPTAILEAARRISGPVADADTSMLALRSMWTRLSKNVDEVNLPGVDWAAADQPVVDKAISSIHDMLTMSSYVQKAKAGLGRGLRSIQLPDLGDYQAAFKETQNSVRGINDVTPLPRNRKELTDWMSLWDMTKGDPTLRAKFLESKLRIPDAGMYLRTSLANWFTAAVLSAPRTLALNVVGPALISTIRTAEKTSGAAMIMFNPFASSAEKAAAFQVAKYSADSQMSTLMQFRDAWHWAVKSAEANKTVLGGGGSVYDTLPQFGPITENLANAAQQNFTGLAKAGYTAGNVINAFPRALNRLNNGLDEFAKRLSYYGETRLQAMVEGAGNGLKGDDLKKFVSDKLDASTNEYGHAENEQLLQSAERTTLTATPGAEGSALRKIYTGIQQARKDVPELRFILPVLNVPANALGETLRRLPIASAPGFNVLFKESAAELAGERGAVAQAEAHGRMIMGTAFLGSGVMLNRFGLLTGAGPNDPTDRKVWLMTHQPYSIRVGDEWVRYDKFDIAGGLLSIPATIMDLTTYRQQDANSQDVFMSGIAALNVWLQNRAAFQTAAQILNVGADPYTENGKGFEGILGSIAASMLVPNAIRTTLTDDLDPFARARHSWGDYIKTAIPLLSKEAEPVRNVLGEPVARANNSVQEAFVPVTMAPTVSYQQDPVADELSRLYHRTGYGAGAPASTLLYGAADPYKVPLESGQSMGDRAMQLRQSATINGKTMRETLKELFDSAEYNAAADIGPGAKTTNSGEAARGQMVSDVFTDFNNQIKTDLANESPIAANWMAAAAAKKQDTQRLGSVPVQQLVANPDLYKAAGVNGQAYLDHILAGTSTRVKKDNASKAEALSNALSEE